MSPWADITDAEIAADTPFRSALLFAMRACDWANSSKPAICTAFMDSALHFTSSLTFTAVWTFWMYIPEDCVSHRLVLPFKFSSDINVPFAIDDTGYFRLKIGTTYGPEIEISTGGLAIYQPSTLVIDVPAADAGSEVSVSIEARCIIGEGCKVVPPDYPYWGLSRFERI